MLFGPLESSFAAVQVSVTPTLSLSSSMILSAVFFPNPLIVDKPVMFPPIPAFLKSSTDLPLKIAKPSLGPIPETPRSTNEKDHVPHW